MFAIAFDLVVVETAARHPRGVAQAYADIGAAFTALKAMPWFPGSVRDIRAFRVEQWSDFTPTVTG